MLLALVYLYKYSLLVLLDQRLKKYQQTGMIITDWVLKNLSSRLSFVQVNLFAGKLLEKMIWYRLCRGNISGIIYVYILMLFLIERSIICVDTSIRVGCFLSEFESS